MRNEMQSIVSKFLKTVRLAAGLTRQAPYEWRRYRFPRSADRLLDGFAVDPVASAAYDELTRYLATSWVTYRNATGSGAHYPGWPSWSGRECDALEGFSRTMPLFGAWCASGRNPVITLPNGKRLPLQDEYKRGLLAGTDPDARSYWGGMPGKSNQRIVEAADVALALWLFRASVWQGLTLREREAVVNWLALVDGHPGLDNNWHLFFVIIDRVLTALGYPGRIDGAREHFDRIKEFHLGDGWFSDGPKGRVDFYSAWGFHYALTWINRIDPAWNSHFIQDTQSEFLKSYRYLIGPRGLPILGRSVQYRMAAPAPLVAGADSHPGIASPGEARRALDVTWSYFLARGALRRGIVTQGYFDSNPRVLDPYAGPASSLWSLRSLVMALYYPPDHPFWRAPTEPLPVERGDFDMTLMGAGWRVTGVQATGTIMIEVLGNPVGAYPGLEPFGRLQILCNRAFGDPPRPKSLNAKYGRRVYRSDLPFFE
jgi:hypothetical protein